MYVPNLRKVGLLRTIHEVKENELFNGAFGFATEKSSGKDTISGHWEIVGCPVSFNWKYFYKKYDSGSYFPDDFMHTIKNESQLFNDVIDAGHGSGTEIINRFGDIHIETGKPIIYTSADSVFQIACHEHYFGLDNLYKISSMVRGIFDSMGYNVGRVIARPFLGKGNGNYLRTVNRRDFSVLPPHNTLLDNILSEGGDVISIGKISDIFAHQGISKQVKAPGLPDLINKTLDEILVMPPSSLLFTNFVNFDCDYGHRRDLKGYAKALEYFDSRLPEIDDILCESDMVVLCADHGCDPTWIGNDHTRELIPTLFWGKKVKPGFLGLRSSFSDVGATIARFLNVKQTPFGLPCSEILNL
jgi:phosphopentomutase